MNPILSTTLPSKSDVKLLSKLGQCEVCNNKRAEYTCPRCEIKTCCLECVKIHKMELECNGQRDKTKFIPLNKFTNLDLLSDYRLLEDVSKVVHTLRKRKIRQNNRISTWSFRLKNQVASKGVDLKFLPNTFKKHKNNSTKFDPAKDNVLWHIEWVFVNADFLKLNETRVPDTLKLSTILHKYLTKQENQELQDKLQFYQAADLPGIRLFLKAEHRKGNKFYRIDSTQTLRECLTNKTIIEYPTIHVILKDHEIDFDIMDSDDENDEMKMGPTSGTEVINKIIGNSEKNDRATHSLKNLLFVSGNTDDEDSNDE